MAEEINILDKFKGYGFNGKKSILRCIIGDNVFIVKDNYDGTYNFIKISKTDYKNAYDKKFNDLNIENIEFDQDFFIKNEDKFIKSLIEQQLNFDKDKINQMTGNDFKKLKVSEGQLSNIKTIKPEEIKDIQPEPIPKKKDEEELMGDEDEEEEEKERMIDKEEEEPIQELDEDAEKQHLGFDEDAAKQHLGFDEDARDFEKTIEGIQIAKQKKQRSGKMGKEDMDVFDQLTRELNFTQPDKKAGKSYIKVGDDVIFIRKPQEKQKGVSKLGENNYLAVKLNKEDVQRIYTKKDLDKIKAEYFNFSTDYFDKNKEKIIDSIKKGKFVLDDELIKNKEESGLPEKFNFEDLKTYDVMPVRNFDYINVLGLRNGNISEKKGDDGQQLITFSKDGKNVTVNLPNKYLSNGYPDSLLKLIVGVSENNKGEVDFKEIGEIQDLNGDITNLYSHMQDLKSKINSSNNAEEKERLLIKYNEKRLKLEDLIKKYSKEAYRLSMLNKKKKATFSNPNYIKNKLNKL